MANLEWFDSNEFHRDDIADGGMLVAGNDNPKLLFWLGSDIPIRMG